MKKTLLIALLTVFSLNASAQNSHQRTLQLLKLMGIEKNVTAMADNMQAMFSQSMVKSDPARARMMSQLIASEIKILTPKLIADMVPIYEKHFTAAELEKFIAFYTTPEGMKLVNAAPLMQKELMGSVMKYIPEMQKRIAEKMQQSANKKRRSI